jgi:hypothetical protein
MNTIIEKVDNSELDYSIDKYMMIINSKCEKSDKREEKENKKCKKTIKKQEKINDEKPYIPKMEEYEMIYENNYNVQQLKYFAKTYKLKIGGNKKELITRLYCFLKLSAKIVKIQCIFRGKLLRKYLSLHGPALLKRELCNNQMDFFTMEDMKDLKYNQFISYKDEDGFVYGFDMVSLYNLILKSGAKNPYNRKNLPDSLLHNIKTIIKLSKVFKVDVNVEIKSLMNEITPEKSTELRVLELFQNIDSLGNYSSPIWFQSLNRNQLFRFVIELRDIWNYRAQLTQDVKRSICPPHGEPFQYLNINYVRIENDLDKVKKAILVIMEKLVNTGIDQDSKTLGAYYVLSALTLVSENAAISLPWLYQSVSF